MIRRWHLCDCFKHRFISASLPFHLLNTRSHSRSFLGRESNGLLAFRVSILCDISCFFHFAVPFFKVMSMDIYYLTEKILMISLLHAPKIFIVVEVVRTGLPF